LQGVEDKIRELTDELEEKMVELDKVRYLTQYYLNIIFYFGAHRLILQMRLLTADNRNTGRKRGPFTMNE
jgi:hypothetical protein